MKAIMTVTGIDHTGIIAAVASALAERDVNILNVSQTLMGEWFTMIMQLELNETVSIPDLQQHMSAVEAEQKLQIRIQSEMIFHEMHRL
ncbi:MAG: ACT domain-containing protein [Actinomycetaceae bacterium]|nr:ACT domain-containing protein [Actinomycetaceae bacterium]